MQVPENEPRAALIAGWSERVLEYVPLFESDGRTVVDRISNMDVPKKGDSKLGVTEPEAKEED